MPRAAIAILLAAIASPASAQYSFEAPFDGTLYSLQGCFDGISINFDPDTGINVELVNPLVRVFNASGATAPFVGDEVGVAEIGIASGPDGIVITSIGIGIGATVNGADTVVPGTLDFHIKIGDDSGPIPDSGPLEFAMITDLGPNILSSPGTYELDCPADVNDDGAATPADFTAWLGCFGGPGSAPYCDRADVNKSGSIEPADFTAWLAAFQAGCDTD